MSKLRLSWCCAAVAACGVAVAVWLAATHDGTASPVPGPAPAADPEPTSERLAALAAQVERASRDGPRIARIEAAPRRVPTPGARPARAATPSAPEGYTFVEHHGEVPTAPFRPRRATGGGPPDDGLDWLGAPGSLARLSAQAEAAGRDWSFGWIRTTPDSRLADIAPTLATLGVVVEGSAGRLVRARLPGDRAGLEAVAALAAVEAVGAAPLPAKLAPAFAEPSPGAESAAGVASAFVTLMASDPDGRWRRELERLGAVVGTYDGTTRTYLANIASGMVDRVAQADFVMFVEPVVAVAGALDTAVPAMGADAHRTYAGEAGVFQGTGGASVPVGIADTGLNVAHGDIASNRDSICGANFVHANRRAQDQDLWRDANGHGTHVAGILAGNGAAQAPYAGMAPLVRHIRFAKVLDTGNTGSLPDAIAGMDFLSQASECSDGGWSADAVKPLIVNLSLATNEPTWSGRDLGARKLDAMVWTHRQLYVVAQGNAGAKGFSQFAAAKGALAVGASLDSGELWASSGLGPTADGRLAPQVVGTGVGVYSAAGNGSLRDYRFKNGTSMASPAVAGVAALLMDAAPDFREKPALTRARLMASAIRPDAWLDDAGAFPTDNSSGPGTLNARFGLGKVSARTSILNRDRPDGWIGGSFTATFADGEYARHDIEVPHDASRLDVVLTWDEPPTEAIANAVLNDLDLWLDHLGDGDDCADDVACGERRSVSRKDNVEWVVVRNPAPGTWRVKVAAPRVYTGAPRAALAWTVVRGSATPELAVTAARNDADNGEVVTVTVDDYVAAGARLHIECREEDGAGETTHCGEGGGFAYATQVDNADGVTATGVARWGDFVALGEIAAGESREVRILNVQRDERPGRTLHFTATAWNAASGWTSVDEDGDADVASPENDSFEAAAILDGTTGSRRADLLLATTEPGEPDFKPGSGRPAGSLWYRWQASAADAVHFSVLPDADYSGDFGSELRIDVLEGNSLAGATPVASGAWSASFFALPDRDYFVRVSNAGRAVEATLHWRQGARPGNDDFASATDIDGEAGSVAGSNLGATLEPGEFYDTIGATVWYRWVASADGRWDFRVSPHRLIVLAFSGRTVDGTRLVSGYPGSSAVFEARAGESYRIAVASRDSVWSGSRFDLSWSATDRAATVGDDFAQAELLDETDAGRRNAFIDSGHSVEPGEPASSGVRTAWWSWTAPTTRDHTWRLVNSYRGQTLAAFAGDSLDTLTEVGHAVGANGEFSFSAEADKAYFFAIGVSPRAATAFASSTLRGEVEWGPTPANDAWSAATPLLTGTTGSVSGSNRYATTEAHERLHDTGHSSLWWTFEAPDDGWYRFWIDATSIPFTLAAFVHAGDAAAGQLEMIASGGGSGDGAQITFEAQAGERFAIRLGTLGSGSGGDFTFRWEETDAPEELIYLGRFVPGSADGSDGIPNPGALAFDPSGRVLYVASRSGLNVLDRDPDTGALTDGDSFPGNLAPARLLWDSHRAQLLVFDNNPAAGGLECAIQSYQAIDGTHRRLRDKGVISVRGTGKGAVPCANLAPVVDPAGKFVYAFGTRDVRVYEYDGDDLRAVQVLDYIRVASDVAISRDWRHVHATQSEGTDEVLVTFERDADTGMLEEVGQATLPERTWAAAVSSDDGYLWTTGRMPAIHSLAAPAAPRLLARLDHTPEYHFGVDCLVVLPRTERQTVDVICRNSVYVARWDASTETLDLAHFLTREPNEDGMFLPTFHDPNRGAAASPDGRHAYVSTRDKGILIFKRAGNPVTDIETDDDGYVRLAVLSVTDERVKFGPLSSRGCIGVDDIELDDVAYTVDTSNWQTRPDKDGTWADIDGTETTGELCAYTPDEAGEYRLVATIDIDGERGMYASNVIVYEAE